jgi:hypothetical protein
VLLIAPVDADAGGEGVESESLSGIDGRESWHEELPKCERVRKQDTLALIRRTP